MIVQSCRVNDGNRLRCHIQGWIIEGRQGCRCLCAQVVVLALWTVPVNLPNNLESAGRRVRVVE